ncbi:methyltransferase family protein [Saprospira grandis DSM 2844]|uniref:Methyltransferase family protein n=1 Tax=Saprospira grandis DSM 2844 TaxID=694433 RepID=J0P586_9BACT|nr:class I SAM-dependent methyltransferase [Saprospira grandis]EJF55054.1 methyltransferase family protein [Saprospira grandis DSM 2844]
MSTTWFADWFDSAYYHLLYNNRNEAEAQEFMRNLLAHLNLEKGSRLLDLACGKGRHSIYLHSQGYEVLGVDLAPESIAAANEQAQEGLSFAVHDMRETLNMGQFDAVLNLFTSFGYFESEEEHLQTLKEVRNMLPKDGFFVMDFMNAHKVIQNLVLAEEKQVGDVLFHLRRYVENGYIVKDIRFEAEGQNFNFQERVRGFLLADLQALFAQAGLEIVAQFGNYQLAPFAEESANRLILIAKAC